MINTTPIPSRSRWQPPSMTPSEPAPLVRVDEAMVRKMLKINPAIRAGRTTQKIKQSLERGDTLTPTVPSSAATVATVATSSVGNPLAQAIDCFVQGKLGTLNAQLKTIDQKINALQVERNSLNETAASDLINFLSLLNPNEVKRSGCTVLQRQEQFLKLINTTADKIIAASIH